VRGWVQNWETGEPVSWWNDENAKPWSDAEKREWERRREGDRSDREKLARRASQSAQVLIDSCVAGPHNYLEGKGLAGSHGLVTPDYALVVPMRAVDDGSLRGAQTIALVENEWTKKFLYGTRAKGSVFRLGPKRAIESIVVEGYATGLSVQMAAKRLCLDAAIYVTFSADNLAHCAGLIAGRRYVIADNDKSGVGQRVAESTGLAWAMPEQLGEDANDLHKRAGLFSLQRLLMSCRMATPGERAL